MMLETQLAGSMARGMVMPADYLGGSYDPAARFRPWTPPAAGGGDDDEDEPAGTVTLESPETGGGVTAVPLDGAGVEQFRGRLEVEGLRTPLPEQTFTVVRSARDTYTIRGDAPYPWPRLTFDLKVASDGKVRAVEINFEPAAGGTVEAELLYTRLEAAFVLDGLCRLRNIDEDVDFGFRVRARGDAWFVTRSLLTRKLKFLEEFFGVRFAIPRDATAGDIRRIEMVFRGVTEGEFTTRRQEVTVTGYAPAAGELDRPPFTGPGAFSHTSVPRVEIYGQLLEVGPVEVHVGRAVATDKRLLRRLRSGELPSADVRVLALDHQIGYRFHDYAGRAAEVGASLAALHDRLSREEPQELADLLTAHFLEDVPADEARKIVAGWLQFHDFPDRYWPQTPAREGDRWRVPVWVAYPKSGGAPVADVFVEVRTGQLTAALTAEEMLERGASAAASLLRAG